MSKQRLWAGLAVLLAIVAIVVIRSGDSEPTSPPSAGEPAIADRALTEGDATGKKKGKSDKSKRVRKVQFRPVKAGETRLSCPDCNVIVISIDGLRADHMGTYGYARKTTPELDRFAKGSVVFENAISQSSWTTPSIASMLTGALPREHGMLYHPAPGSLSPKADTLATRLGAAGYRSAGFHGGGYVTKSMGKGFKTWKSADRTLAENLESARDWLAEHGHQKFFMFLQGYDLQKPYLHTKLNTFHKPKTEYDMMAYCKRNDTRVLQGDELDYAVAQYDAGIVAADKVVGKFLNFLRDKKLFGNTVIIVTSAHGEELYEHGGCDHKQSVYRELVHVPLIMHVPTRVKKRVPVQVAASISLKPTILAMVGASKDVDALDLRSAATDKAPHGAILSETGVAEIDKSGNAKQLKLLYYKAAITTPDFKLVYNRQSDKDSWELYDVAAKPAEKIDLASKDAARVSRMKALLFPPKGVPVVPALPTPQKKSSDASGDGAKAKKLPVKAATSEKPSAASPTP